MKHPMYATARCDVMPMYEKPMTSHTSCILLHTLYCILYGNVYIFPLSTIVIHLTRYAVYTSEMYTYILPLCIY
jgi:hypothetical protein